MIKTHLSIIDLGISDYLTILHKQKELWQKRVADQISDTLILVEHEPVFTIGKHGNLANLLIPESFLRQKNISIHRIERGGDITFHGPGQLVGYPIFKLAQPMIGIKNFVYQIEKVLCRTLQRFHINASVDHPQIGVWVNREKIASIGIAVKNRVSFHGFALNIATDLSYFDYINPCGMNDIKMTSMEKILNKKISMFFVKQIITNEFKNSNLF